MKIEIVDSGMAGSTAACALVMSGVGRQIVLVYLNRERAEAEVGPPRCSWLNHLVAFDL